MDTLTLCPTLTTPKASHAPCESQPSRHESHKPHGYSTSESDIIRMELGTLQEATENFDQKQDRDSRPLPSGE